MNIHSKEYAQMQRERIHKTKPWLKTKGAITPEGKAISKMNALKTSPELHQLMNDYRMLMNQQKELDEVISLKTTLP
ncbi:hypothetical protein ACLHDG_08920 [Sulfurovum sp. CS9]|jgi:hypothetical protein|uniref:hypothetical protein n=1 Tax=Sulfurovum sp. CS9 TaxID=3391146 RepID=UPI0039E89B5E